MHPIPLTASERKEIVPGEPVSLATVIVVFTIVILTIVAFKIFQSDSAKIQMPNGFKFEWDL